MNFCIQNVFEYSIDRNNTRKFYPYVFYRDDIILEIGDYIEMNKKKRFKDKNFVVFNNPSF